MNRTKVFVLLTAWAALCLFIAPTQAGSYQTLIVHRNDHHFQCPPIVPRKVCYQHIKKHDLWVLHHAKRFHFSWKIVSHHKRELKHAKAHLKKIYAREHPTFSYPWWWVPLGECETGVSPPDPAYGKAGHPGGDGYEGWINFLNSTWLSYGGGQFASHAYDASEHEQFIVTMRMHRDVPWSQSNPDCSARLGM